MAYQREVFENAPLAFVTCELRFPVTPRLASDAVFESLIEQLADQMPIPSLEETTMVASVISETETPVDLRSERRMRFMNKARNLSLVIGRTSLIAETTEYEEWPMFLDVVLNAVETVSSVVRVPGIERIGLRYIDEIRIPDPISEVADWRGWVADKVLDHINVAPGYRSDSTQIVVRLSKDEDRLTARYATLHGRGVVGEQPLSRKIRYPEGPFFVVDIDSYHEAIGEKMIDFAVDPLAATLDRLHAPIGELFYNSVTDATRKIFRGEQ